MTPLPRPVWPGYAVINGPHPCPPERQPRRITQLCAMGETLYALCSDGSVWERRGATWLPEPGIPQRQLGGEE